jgi:hypothetical protein
MRSAMVFFALLPAGDLPAQVSQTTTFERRVEITATAPGAAQTGAFGLLAAGAALEGKVVKGAPYSAQGVTETVRVLADGTRIVQRSFFRVFRDKEGRTRHEYTLGAAGEGAPAGDAPATITIYDPVAGAVYLLNPADKTARRVKVSIEEQVSSSGEAGEKRSGEVIERDVTIPAPAMSAWFERRLPGPGGTESTFFGGAFGGERMIVLGPDAQQESLGERTIEGVLARGTRITHTIPAGRIGNDRPITIVHERWHSPELDVTLLSETKNPLSGDVTFRLGGLQRGEPSPSLFEIPPDYQVQESGIIQRRLRVIDETGRQKR